MYWTGTHTKHRLRYHFVWVPKYRKRVIKGKIKKSLEKLLQECAEINRWKIDELSVQTDHIHILMQIKPNISVSKCIQIFKGGTSKQIREDFPELEEFLWGDSFWSDGYFAETIGRCDEEIIRKYIQEQ